MSIRYLSGINVDNNVLFVDSANNVVGVSTAAPYSGLSTRLYIGYAQNNSVVNQDEFVSVGAAGGSTNKAGINFLIYNAGYGGRIYTDDSTATIRALAFDALDSNTFYNAMNITRTTSPNVLIGTTTDAGYKLFVNGSIVNNTNINSTGDPGLMIGSGLRLGFDESGVRSWNIKATGGNLAFNSGDGNGSFTFGASVTASSLIKSGGTSSQYLMADGSVSTIQTANVYTQTFFIPEAGGTAQWVKVGTWTAAQGGQVVTVEIAGHAGYNATTGQNHSVYIYMKTSNGSSVDPSGFAADSSFYTQGLNASIGAGGVIWEANAAGVSATTYTLYVLFGAYTNGSQYTVTSRGGTWANVGTLTAPSGTTSSSTILLSEFRYSANNQLLTLSGNSNVLIGGTTNNGEKLQVYGGGITVGGTTYPSIAFYPTIGTNFGITNRYTDNRLSIDVIGTGELINFLSNGNVGINSTNPGERLVVNAASGGNSIIYATTDTGQAGLKLLAGTGSTNRATRIDFLNGVASGTVPRWTLLNDYNQNGTNDFRFIKEDQSTSVLTLYQSGNVGVGTTTDGGYKLDVNGTFRSQGIANIQNGYYENKQLTVGIGETKYLYVDIQNSYGNVEVLVAGYGGSGSASCLISWIDGGHNGGTPYHRLIQLARQTQGNPVLGNVIQTGAGGAISIQNTGGAVISLFITVKSYGSNAVAANAYLSDTAPTGNNASILNIDDINSRVGIGTTSPITKLTIGSYAGARLPYINATANTFDANGITVTSSNSANAAIGGGIDLTNNLHSVGSYSPIISFSALSQSGIYNNSYAGIWGILAGAGGDANWNVGHIAFGVASSFGIAESMRLTGNGHLLIGTTTDSGAKLNVNGTSYISGAASFGSTIDVNGNVTLTQDSNDLIFQQTNSSSHGIVWKNTSYTKDSASIRPTGNGAWATQGIGFYTGNAGDSTTAPSLRFNIQAAGDSIFYNNVGIGTTSPAANAKLTIDGSAGANTSQIDMVGFNSTAKGHLGQFSNNLYLSTNYYYSGGQYNDTAALGQAAIVLSAGATTASFIDFNLSDAGANNPSSKVRIGANGNVLIGTTTDAGYKLDVNGTGRFGVVRSNYYDIPSGTGFNSFQMGADTSAGGYYVYNLTTGTYNFVISNGGNVLIGTTTDAGYKLDVNGTLRSQGSLYTAGRQYVQVSGNTLVAYKIPYNGLANVGGTTVSDSQASDGTAMVRYSSAGNNTFFYGPYTTLEPGNYVAKFRIKVASNASASYIGYIDIIGTNVSGNAVSLRPNMFPTGGNYYYIDMPFTCNGSASNIEFRWIGWVGGITDTYLDHILVTSQAQANNVYVQDGQDYTIYEAQLPRLTILGGSGQTGIGNPSPTNYSGYQVLHLGKSGTTGLLKLATPSSSDGPEIFSSSDSDVVINTNSTDTRIRIKGTTGNVLIGSGTDAGYKLDVHGTGYFRNVLRAAAANTFPIRAIATNGNVSRISFEDPVNTSNDAVWVGSEGYNLCFGSSYNEQARISSSGNLIIGSTTDAGYKLDVHGEIIGRDDIRIFNTYALILNGTDANWRIGRNTITDTGWLTGNTMQMVVFGGSTGQGFQVVNTNGTALFEIDGVAGASRFTNALGVGVNPSGTAGRIDASNDIVAFSTSDRRFKENITPIANALDKVKTLTGVEFDWKKETKDYHGYVGHDVGVIAQDVQAVLPEAVRTNANGYLSVRYEKMIALLVEANKELAARVEELEKKLK